MSDGIVVQEWELAGRVFEEHHTDGDPGAEAEAGIEVVVDVEAAEIGQTWA